MPWTYDQKIQRVCRAFEDKGLLEASQIQTVQRPLFFGTFPFAISFAPVREKWFKYDELKEFVVEGLKNSDISLQSNRFTLEFHLFSGDTNVLRWLLRNQAPFYFNHLRLVDPACWSMKLPKPQPKTKFFEKYGWRIEFKDPKWALKDENIAELERLGGDLKITCSPRANPKTFLYLSKLNDVLLFKLIVGDQILDIEDRSSL
jgi:hypothetical protein